MKFLRRYRERMARLEREAAEAEALHQRVNDKWPEVMASSEWARQTIHENGLSALFKESLREKHT